jgi:hypothetical protein
MAPTSIKAVSDAMIGHFRHCSRMASGFLGRPTAMISFYAFIAVMKYRNFLVRWESNQDAPNQYILREDIIVAHLILQSIALLFFFGSFPCLVKRFSNKSSSTVSKVIFNSEYAHISRLIANKALLRASNFFLKCHYIYVK